jgi:hypothetical protein
LGPLGTAATNRPIVPAPGEYDDGEIDGIMSGRGNRSTRRKPAPVPLCPPQTPHAAWMRSRAAAVGSQVKNFLFSTSSSPVLRPTQPPIQWVPWALFPGVKWPGREAYHSLSRPVTGITLLSFYLLRNPGISKNYFCTMTTIHLKITVE